MLWTSISGTRLDPARDIVVVTGGALGLGKLLAIRLSALGVRVAVLDITKVLIEDEITGVSYHVCDVGSIRSIKRCQRAIIRKWGPPTVIINNAATAHACKLMHTSAEELDASVRVNLLLSFYVARVFVPEMVRMNRGYVVTVASALAFMTPARFGAYGVSKAGLYALNEALTYEIDFPLQNHGVKTLIVTLGQLRTSLFHGVETPLSLFAPELEPEVVAEFLVDAMRLGKRGSACLPLYARLIPLARAIPWPFLEILRRSANIDHAAEKFRPKAAT